LCRNDKRVTIITTNKHRTATIPISKYSVVFGFDDVAAVGLEVVVVATRVGKVGGNVGEAVGAVGDNVGEGVHTSVPL
jgi:hypothetical protein